MNLSQEQKTSMIQAGYSRKSIELLENDVNYGKMESPDLFTYQIGSCGDIVFLYAILGKKNVIEDLKFRYVGCTALAASCSALTQLVIGKKISQISISADEILLFLEGLPGDHHHCPELACETMKRLVDIFTDMKKLTEQEHKNYRHFCGLTGAALELSNTVSCNFCSDVKKCENDHFIIKD
jgi:NifU-like protein involved in Fe-S cluster formation